MIRKILDSDLKDILNIQSRVYSENLVESPESVISKFRVSSDTCFVHMTNEKINSYCLAYPYPKLTPPPLNNLLNEITLSKNIFLHDLSVTPEFAGNGIARKMLSKLFEICFSQNFNSITLMAVQNSETFWQKFGFKIIKSKNISPTYGVDSKLMLCDNVPNN